MVGSSGVSAGTRAIRWLRLRSTASSSFSRAIASVSATSSRASLVTAGGSVQGEVQERLAAEGLAQLDLRTNRGGARGPFPNPEVLGANAQRDLAPRPLGQQPGTLGRGGDFQAAGARDHALGAALDPGLDQIHGRRADESGDEQVAGRAKISLGEASCWITPLRITATRSPIVNASV